ncbi:orotidine-5'-phosphate decarboxylase [Cerasibacillus terrae]|uniref:Orotidine 5'-phosphate decarboxylase n=1 Tax=Cerasibacillus terrae TaxID=2498845 RepID=A0A5C8P239_9BACI|nr:orotidine-5'-phosphate decarboxylase [Cerasibacillus terrae]TXL67621.1 orotidine-5'-phosphate decarboxylase [Cerasibacillus terrae]
MIHPIYLALDFPTWQETKQFIETYGFKGVPVKVGMELFYREGPVVIEKLKQDNHPIFLDLKLHDIPTTVMKAMRNISTLGVDMVNVHALGGSEMIKWAKEGLLLGGSGIDTKLIAVTILTSMSDEKMNEELMINGTVKHVASHLANMANESGADGVVCSVHEARKIKQVCGNDFLTVTPGIRLEQSQKDDQERVATPAYAKKAGADILVIGRSVTKANDPVKAYKQAMEEWNNGLES